MPFLLKKSFWKTESLHLIKKKKKFKLFSL
jgi:hypothetical protein